MIDRRNLVGAVAVFSLLAAVFIANLTVESGPSFELLYVLSVPLAFWTRSLTILIAAVGTATLLVVLSYILREPDADGFSQLLNSAYILIAIWIAAGLARLGMEDDGPATNASSTYKARIMIGSSQRYFYRYFWRFFLGGLTIALAVTVLLLGGYRTQAVSGAVAHNENLMDLAKSTIQQDLWLLVTDSLSLADWMSREISLNQGQLLDVESLTTNFVRFSQSKAIYDQVRFLSPDGRESVRVNFNMGQPAPVELERLQDKSDTSYFRHAQDLSMGQVYLSALELNREKGVIERPFKPVIRAVTPVFSSSNSSLAGYVVINYDANSFQREIRTGSAVNEGVFQLINSLGTWILHPDREREWGGEFSDQGNFINENPFVWDFAAVSDAQQMDYQGYTFSFNWIELVPDGGHLALADNIVALNDTAVVSQPEKILALAQVKPPTFMSIVTACPRTAGTYALTAFLLVMAASIIGARITLRWLGAQLKIESSEAYLAAVLDTQVDGLITIDDRGIIQTASATAQKMFGYSEKELLGKNVKMLMMPFEEQNHDLYLAKYIETRQGTIIGHEPREVLGRRKNGEEIELELAVGEAVCREGPIFVGSLRDITARKNTERALKKFESNYKTLYEKEYESRMALMEATDKLRRSNEELEQFAYVASHDLKSPLRGIQNLATWIEEELGETSDETVHEYLKLMKSRISRLETLLDDILSYSRIGRKDRDEEDIDLNELLPDLRELMDVPSGFEIIFAPNLPHILAPPGVVKQVFGNLISNAIKHHDREQGRIEVLFNDADDYWLFEVRDDGPGVPEKFRQKVFAMFQTLQSRDATEGSGMGLALVSKMVRVYGGGEIMVTSGEEGRGARFVFTWKKSASVEEQRWTG